MVSHRKPVRMYNKSNFTDGGGAFATLVGVILILFGLIYIYVATVTS